MVSGLTSVTAISVGARHSCALLLGGTVKCWGQDVFGQLGNNSLLNAKAPVAVSGLVGATAIAGGHGAFVRVVDRRNGQVLGTQLVGPARQPGGDEAQGRKRRRLRSPRFRCR